MKERRSQLEYLPLRQLGDQKYPKTKGQGIPRQIRACLEEGMLSWRRCWLGDQASSSLRERDPRSLEYTFRRPSTEEWANTQRSQWAQG